MAQSIHNLEFQFIMAPASQDLRPATYADIRNSADKATSKANAELGGGDQS